MLYEPVLSQLSIGSMNVVSHRYLSSSCTWTDFKFNFVNGPLGLWLIVILKMKNNFLKFLSFLWIKSWKKTNIKRPVHSPQFFVITETLKGINLCPDIQSSTTAYSYQFSFTTHWRISHSQHKKKNPIQVFELLTYWNEILSRIIIHPSAVPVIHLKKNHE